MDQQRKIIIAVSAGTAAAMLAMATIAMFPHHSGRPQHMSGLKVSGPLRVPGSRLRWSRCRPGGGGPDRFAWPDALCPRDAEWWRRGPHRAFRAQLDKPGRVIDLTVPVAAVVNDAGALITPAPDAAIQEAKLPDVKPLGAKLIIASASPRR